MTRLESERLVLRPWRDADLAPFAALNADAEVMHHFPSILATTQSNQFAQRVGEHIVEHGWGLWAVEVPGVSPFIGFVGLARPSFTAHFTPAVEVGWRLARTAWGRGYATEAARAAVDYGFDRLALAEIVSFTTTANRPSRRVMEKLGMSHDPVDDFDHPSLEAGDSLRRHVLYRLANQNLPNAMRHTGAQTPRTGRPQ